MGKRNSRKKTKRKNRSKSQVKRKKTKSKGGTITGSLRKKYEAEIKELKKKSRRLKNQTDSNLKTLL